MYEEFIELALHAVMLLMYTVITLILTGVGLFFEYRSYLFLSGGDGFLAVWMGGLGVLMLAFSYLIARDKLANAYEEFQSAV